MAITTSHTVHVAVLPDPSHLRSTDTGPVRLKAFTVGSTTHVSSRSTLASTVWHPLGVSGHCLVTTTTDAIVRIWEFDLENRWSFDKPSLTIDLKHLANGLPQEEDADSDKVSSSRIFSPDLVEMEVAATCFGGHPTRMQDPWAAMTLWIAMREGDVYALCPLLPTKWVAPPWLVPCLAASISSKLASAAPGSTIPASERHLYEMQWDWILEVEEEKIVLETPGSGGTGTVVYKRPEELGAIPDLQGPLAMEMTPEEDDAEAECLLTDICVVSPKLDQEQRSVARKLGFRRAPRNDEEFSWGIVCLLASTGRVHVLVNTESIRGQWPIVEEVHFVPAVLAFLLTRTCSFSTMMKYLNLGDHILSITNQSTPPKPVRYQVQARVGRFSASILALSIRLSSHMMAALSTCPFYHG